MLKVVSVTNLGQETININEYTLRVDWNESLGQTFYWTAAPPSKSFLEIGMHWYSGRIQRIALITLWRIVQWTADDTPLCETPLPRQNGSPIFHTEPGWTEDVDILSRHFPEEFIARVGSNIIAFEFGNRAEVAECIVSGRVCFGLNAERFLSIIEIGNLSADETLNLRQLISGYEYVIKRSRRRHWWDKWCCKE